jgi:baseplate hub protein gp41
LELTVYGLSKSTINRLSTLGMRLNLVPQNSIVLEAGDDSSGMATVFTGYILAAIANFNAQPDVAFYLSAFTLAPQSVEPAKASSFKGTADVATIMSGFATQMGLKFENNGVQVTLQNPYYSGSVKTQAQTCVDDAGIAWNHGDLGILAIWPKFGSRGGLVPLISPQTGMIGYPTYSALGVDVRTLYNPSVGFGSKVQVQSSIEAACGVYSVCGLAHHLACEMPDGPWFSTVNCYAAKFNLNTS